MRCLIVLVFFLACSTSAFAMDRCENGAKDVFKFVSWSAKLNRKKNVEINLTFHNALDQSFRGASFGMNMIDGNGKEIDHLSLQIQEDVLANADHVETYLLDASSDVADKVNSTTPWICAYDLIDSKTGKHTTYPKADPSISASSPTYTKPEDVKSPVPFPTDAVEIIDSPPAHMLNYATPQKLVQLTEFYRSKYKEMGWTEKYFKSDDRQTMAQFENTTSDWVLIEIEATDTGTKVRASGPYPKN